MFGSRAARGNETAQSEARVAGDDIRPPATPSKEEAVVEEWKTAHREVQGYRWDKAICPKGLQDAVEVSSWLQVPEILARLQVGSQSPLHGGIRIVFPEPDPTSPDAAATIETQREIRAFIVASAGKRAEEVRAAVVAKLEGVTLPGGMSAESWYDCHVKQEHQQSFILCVSSILECPTVAGVNEASSALSVALQELSTANDAYSVTIVVPDSPSGTIYAPELANALGNMSYGELPDEVARKVKIWVGDAAHFGGAGQPKKEIKEYSISEFIDHVAKKEKKDDEGSKAQEQQEAQPEAKRNDKSKESAESAEAHEASKTTQEQRELIGSLKRQVSSLSRDVRDLTEKNEEVLAELRKRESVDAALVEEVTALRKVMSEFVELIRDMMRRAGAPSERRADADTAGPTLLLGNGQSLDEAA